MQIDLVTWGSRNNFGGAEEQVVDATLTLVDNLISCLFTHPAVTEQYHISFGLVSDHLVNVNPKSTLF